MLAHHDDHHHRSCGCCFIVPPRVLRDISRDTSLDIGVRKKLQETFAETNRLKVMREAGRIATLMQARSIAPKLAETTPQEQIFDCKHTQNLPGKPIGNPQSAGEAASTVFNITRQVADFYRSVLGRNSVDGEGMDLVSSLHYRQHFDNAFWNGQQMVYGDGDGSVFTEFYNSPDVIGHELTHGVTQHESGLRYEGEPGALNESISDVFGSVFHQWLEKWPAANSDGWLIGAGIMGPKSLAKKYTCLRDMLDPGASHCLSPQPGSYDNFDPAGDVHENSGIPNRAFALFAQAVGGNAWDQAIKVWYDACTQRHLSSGATFSEFKAATLEAAAAAGVQQQAAAAWKAVNVP